MEGRCACSLVGAPPAALCRRLGFAIQHVTARGAPYLASDFPRECEQRTRELLHHARERILCVPDSCRCAYCEKAVRRCLARFAESEAADRRRAVSLDALIEDAGARDGLGQEPVAPPVDLFAGLPLEDQTSSDDLAGALRRLPPAERRVLDLLHRQQLSTSEAAQLLGVSEDAVRQAHSRARRRLRGLLPGWCSPDDPLGGGDGPR